MGAECSFVLTTDLLMRPLSRILISYTTRFEISYSCGDRFIIYYAELRYHRGACKFDI